MYAIRSYYVKQPQRFDEFSYLGFRRESVIYAPLVANDEVTGIICMANRADDSSFFPEDLKLLSTIAAQASYNFV